MIVVSNGNVLSSAFKDFAIQDVV